MFGPSSYAVSRGIPFDSDVQQGVIVVGSTGSIGTQALDIVRQHPDKLYVVALAAHSHTDELFRQAQEFCVPYVVVGDEDKQALGGEAAGSESIVTYGYDALLDLCDLDADIIVNSLVGAVGLRVSYAALQSGKRLALANKESLVVGGDLLMPLAHKRDELQGYPGTLMPIDSEHGAIYQCLLGENIDEVTALWVTASGGPFRGKKRADLEQVTPVQALAHPTWHMGPKITIDSSTLMNKGLEVIEAHHLFDMPYDKIQVVVQPQSAIHSMVEFSDGSVKAHLGTTDMRIPIQFALSFPERWSAPVAPLDFRTLGSLEFAAPDMETFRCLALAYKAGAIGGTLPCAMNAANEIAVAAFLAEELPFLGIAEVIEMVMDLTVAEPVHSIEQLMDVDAVARAEAKRLIAMRS